MALDLLGAAKQKTAQQTEAPDGALFTSEEIANTLIADIANTPAPVAALAPVAPPPPQDPFAQLKQTTTGFALQTQVVAPLPAAVVPQMAPPAASPVPPPPEPGSPNAIALAAIAQTVANTPAPLQMGDFPNQPVNTEADAVTRFREMLQHLATNLNAPEIAENLATTLRLLDTHAFLAETMKPIDIQIFVRTMRAAYGTVIAKKTERVTKRKKTAEKTEEVFSNLAHLDF